MTPTDPNRPSDGDGRIDPFGEESIGRIVRDLAGSWEMPPVRLDQPSWRARLRPRATRRLAPAQGWLGRLGQAAVAAVTLTVVASLVAVWLTRPPQAAKPSDSAAPRATGTPASPVPSDLASSPLPKLLVDGELPTPTNVLVQLEQGDFARVDLAEGKLGSAITGSSWPSDVREHPDGTMTCICFTASGYSTGGYTHDVISLVRYDAAGKVTSRTTIAEVDGTPDPRDGPLPEQPPHLLTAVTYSPDDRYAFVGWSGRAHPVWRSELIVVDLSSDTVAGRFALPDHTDGDGDTRTVVDAPRVVGQAAPGGVAIARGGYSWSPAASPSPAYHFESEAFSASFDAGQLGVIRPLAGAEGCGEQIEVAGSLSSGGTWLACRKGGESVVRIVRRIDASGTILGDSQLFNGAEVYGLTAVSDPGGTFVYFWDAIGQKLTRVDLATGDTAEVSVPKVTARADDPLVSIGRWLAPTTAAKMFLQAGLVLSPDGSRLYALGVDGPETNGMSGSTGVFVFDTATLTFLERWSPTADFVSMALDADGRYLYVAGMPGVDATGRRTEQPASITVFDTKDGSIRLVAGRLGRGLITFPSQTMH
jgi:hypothetical protein